MEITQEIATKVLETIDAGLVSGLGKPILGQMCVEAAVCYAMGLPHGDEPGCVAPALRRLKITLNDAGWSSPSARAAGMRRLGLIQLGSAGVLNEVIFAQRLVPVAKRAAAAANAANATNAATSTACADYAAALVARAAVYAARAYAARAAVYAAAAAANAANAAVYAARAAMKAADYATNADKILADFAESVVQILVEMGVPGVQWLTTLAPEVNCFLFEAT